VGGRPLRPEVATQRTSTGPTATGDEGDFPGNLVDNEEGETNYYDPTQLNKHVRERHVWSPVKLKQLRNYSFNVLPNYIKGRQRDTMEILTATSGTSSTHSSAGCQLSIAIARTSPSSAEPQLSDLPGFFFAAMPSSVHRGSQQARRGWGPPRQGGPADRSCIVLLSNRTLPKVVEATQKSKLR
jgi:hypothetical protein